VQHFQEILAVLKEEHKKEEDRWFEWSKWAVGALSGTRLSWHKQHHDYQKIWHLLG
jgi:hypothetical protein